MGERPFLSTALTSAPRSTRNLTTSSWQFSAAQCSGVQPFSSAADKSAPWLTNSLTVSICPPYDAIYSAVRPLRSIADILAPCSRRSRTSSVWPRSAAICNGVAPRAFAMFTLTTAPLLRSSRTIRASLLLDAKASGVHPPYPTMVASAPFSRSNLTISTCP
ncbi:hypothetical protein BDV34DRAFT_92702 [Aspergillus parasiticus]|uniref:Uncharacterized protein n=1 Tax=Aspergillus parasiticus TaxID=5067 RepID=A0A5N6DM01_ASPPA|nr:hypothetical protein BDV34DRAFT_92702 [Aspergillus parasiticus]